MDFRRLLLAIFALALAGCGPATTGGNPAPGATLAPTAATDIATTPAPTLATSPVLLTVDQAATLYAAVAAKYGKAAKAAHKKYGVKLNNLKAQKKYWALIAKVNDVFIDEVKAIAFPVEVRPDANALVKAAVVFQRQALLTSKAKSYEQLATMGLRAYNLSDKVGDKAALLRDALGLPPNA